MMTRAKKMVAAEQRGETLYERMLDGACVGYSDSRPTGRYIRMDGREYDERLGLDGRLYRVRFDEDAAECFREILVDELR